MLKFREKSIKQMFSLFLWITLVVVAICSVFTFAFLYNSIASTKKSALDSVCYSADRIITEHIDAITEVELIFNVNRDIQEFLRDSTGENADSLKINTADFIHNTLGVKGFGLGTALFSDASDRMVLNCNGNPDEEEAINKLYLKYKEIADEPETSNGIYLGDTDNDNDLFVLKLDQSSYPEFYICHFTPVVYHSMKEVNSYKVGTIAVFSKINTYELNRNVEKTSLMHLSIENSITGESVVLIDANNDRVGKGTVQSQRIGYTDWYIRAELFEILGVNFFSPFVVLSIILLFVLLLYVFVLSRSIRVYVDAPVSKISNYLEEFMLSKKDRAILENVNVEEFDDILEYINKLFDRVTDQAHIIVDTQQRMYEKELLASEQTLYMNQLQINPHFLFNTLNSITQMCIAKGLDDVTEITNSIAEIFRYCIEGDYKTTIDEEIYIVLKYLKIFNNRYGREFKCELDIEDDLYEFEVMKMILQPLIENSFKHGGVASVEEPQIKISAYREDGYIIISVFDNGAGISPDKLRMINLELDSANTKNNKGIGLFNINKRLQLYYGDDSGMKVLSEEGKYTEVFIRIKEKQ